MLNNLYIYCETMININFYDDVVPDMLGNNYIAYNIYRYLNSVVNPTLRIIID